MAKLVQIEYYIMLPISIALWVYESSILGDWSVSSRKISVILIFLLVFIGIIVWIPWIIYRKKVLDRVYPSYILSVRHDDSYLSPYSAMFRLLSFAFTVIIAATALYGVGIVIEYG